MNTSVLLPKVPPFFGPETAPRPAQRAARAASANGSASAPVPTPASQPVTTQFASYRPVLKVVGLGGGGCNAVNRMIDLGIEGVEFINCNTDYQALRASKAHVNIPLGPQATRGLGAGGQPARGRDAAMESRATLRQALAGADMVFLTAGMGGGTGTGSIPVVAAVAREVGAVTIAVVTMPFQFEQGRRQQNAQEGVRLLQEYTDTLITIPNERLLGVAGNKLALDMAFRLADDVLRQAVQGLTETMTMTGLINVDFAHIKRLMKQGGGAYMSLGIGQGPDRATQAVTRALNHPLLDAIPIEQATGMIANFSGADLTLFEINDTMQYLHSRLNPKADIVWGVSQDARLKDKAQVILVLTGLGGTPLAGVSAEAAPAVAVVEAAPVEAVPVAAAPVAASPSPAELAPLPEEPVSPASTEPARRPLSQEKPELYQALFARPVKVGDSAERSQLGFAARSAGAPAFKDAPTQPASTVRADPLDIPAFMRRNRYTGKLTGG